MGSRDSMYNNVESGDMLIDQMIQCDTQFDFIISNLK